MRQFGFAIRFARFFGLAACLLAASCNRQQLTSLTEVEPRSDRVVSLEDVKPNATTHYTFKILNSSDSLFTVKKVKAPCLCLFEKDIVGIQTKAGEVLEVPCVLPVGSKQETALLEIFTNSNAAEFRHVQLKLTATPKMEMAVEKKASLAAKK